MAENTASTRMAMFLMWRNTLRTRNRVVSTGVDALPNLGVEVGVGVGVGIGVRVYGGGGGSDVPIGSLHCRPSSASMLPLFVSMSQSSLSGYQCHSVFINTGIIKPNVEKPKEPTSDTIGPMLGATVATNTVHDKYYLY